MSGYRPISGCRRCNGRLLEATETQEKEVKEHNAKVDAAVAQIRETGCRFAAPVRRATIHGPPRQAAEPIREDVRMALAIELAKPQ